MPELSEMICPICEQVTKADVIAANGMCDECKEALKDTPDLKPEDESDPEIRKAVERFRKRKAYQQKYNAKPEVKAQRKEYQASYNKRQAEALRKAKELGLL